MELKQNDRDNQIDQLESVMINNFPVIDCPIRHFFTDGLYAREMSAPADSLITSKIHKTEHLFILSKGSLCVWDENGNEVILEAPYIGITKAGTRRVAYIIEDVVWTTFHANPENENEIEIEERIIEKHDNELLHQFKKMIP